jgi:hypothetical protein
MEIMQILWDAITDALSNLTGALVSGAEQLIYSDLETKQLSVLAIIVFTLTGVSIAFAIVKWLLGLLKLN